MKNKTHFGLQVFSCDFHDALLIVISLNKHETWSSFILNSCKQILGLKRVATLWWAGPDLAIGNIGLSIGPQDPRGPPANCGTHRVNCRYMISSTTIRQNFMP